VKIASRKRHGNAYFDLDLATTGPVTVEPRLPGTAHTIVFIYNNPIVSVAGASAFDLTNGTPIGVIQPATGTNEIVVALSSIPDRRLVSVFAQGLNGTNTSGTAVFSTLLGDVSGNAAVNAADISAIRHQLSNVLTQANFIYDVNLSGAITADDIQLVKSRSGKRLAP